MPIKITKVTSDFPEIKAGKLVIVKGELVLVTVAGSVHAFRGVILANNQASHERLFRVCDAWPFNGTVTISNK